MQHDEVIWGVINNQFCSFKSKIKGSGSLFCRNEYNVDGLCNQRSCPLANSRYATVREMDGKCFLYIKTIERAHSPKNLWEKIKLSKNYTKALEQISQHLEYWPKKQIHKNKQRLTKIHQFLIRMRKLRMKAKPKMVVINKKVERREERREQRAKTAAKLEDSIEKELLERLQKGTYGDIYNFPEKEYTKCLDENEMEPELEEEEEDEADDLENDIEFVEDFDGESEDDMEDFGEDSLDGETSGSEDNSDDSNSDSNEDENDFSGGKRSRKNDAPPNEDGKKKKRKMRKGPYVEVEYEDEHEAAPRDMEW